MGLPNPWTTVMFLVWFVRLSRSSSGATVICYVLPFYGRRHVCTQWPQWPDAKWRVVELSQQGQQELTLRSVMSAVVIHKLAAKVAYTGKPDAFVITLTC